MITRLNTPTPDVSVEKGLKDKPDDPRSAFVAVEPLVSRPSALKSVLDENYLCWLYFLFVGAGLFCLLPGLGSA